MKIHRFKQWYQVTNNSYTLAQFLTWAEADFFRQKNTPFEDICLTACKSAQRLHDEKN